jgi:hypothetical protein
MPKFVANVVHRQVGRIRQMFKWAAANQLIPLAVELQAARRITFCLPPRGFPG